MSQFPSNSHRSAQAAGQPRVRRVTSAVPGRRRRSLSRRFSDVLLEGDPRAATTHVIFEVLLPEFKTTLVEVAQSWVERVIQGDAVAPRRGIGTIVSPLQQGRVQYETKSQTPQPRSLSREARTRHNFDDIILASRPEADEVRTQLYECLSRFEQVSVADLYEMVGIEPSHTDVRWGWSELRGTEVMRNRSGGYYLKLPQPEQLD